MQVFKMSVLSCLLVASAGCGTFSGSDSGAMTAEKVVAMMEKAETPRNGMKNFTSAQITLTIEDTEKEQDRPEMISITTKTPDKIRFLTRYRDKFIVKGWDGQVGWEYSSLTGYRLLHGAELDEIRFQGAYLSPGMKINRLFPKIRLEGTATVNGRQCWKLQMTPAKKFHSQDLYFYVDQKSGLVIKTEEIVDTATSTVQVKTVFADYKPMDGMMFPGSMIAEVNGNIVESRVTDVKWDIPVEDLIFAPPAALTGKK